MALLILKVNKEFLQFEALVEDRVQVAPPHARLLLAAIREQAPRQEFNDHERVAEPVRVEGDNISRRQDLHAEAIVMEVDAHAQHPVRRVERARIVLDLHLLFQTAGVVQINELLRLGPVQRDLLLDSLVRRAFEQVERQALALRVQEVDQHQEGGVQTVVKLAEFVLAGE